MNTAKDMQRRKRYHDTLDDVPEQAVAQEAVAHDQAEQQQLWQSIYRLPEKQRDALLCVYAEGLTHKEVAEIMGCRESTVSWYIHKAKKQLNQWAGSHG